MYANIRARDLKSQDLRRPRKTQGASLPVPSEPLSAALQFLKAILDGHKVLLQFNPAKLPLRNHSHTFSRLFQFHSKISATSTIRFHRFDSIFCDSPYVLQKPLLVEVHVLDATGGTLALSTSSCSHFRIARDGVGSDWSMGPKVPTASRQ